MNKQEMLFKALGMNVVAFLAKMDLVMLRPSSVDRGEEIGRLCAELEMANDRAMRFGLGLERKGVRLRRLSR
jgi:hypothetical protein